MEDEVVDFTLSDPPTPPTKRHSKRIYHAPSPNDVRLTAAGRLAAIAKAQRYMAEGVQRQQMRMAQEQAEAQAEALRASLQLTRHDPQMSVASMPALYEPIAPAAKRDAGRVAPSDALVTGTGSGSPRRRTMKPGPHPGRAKPAAPTPTHSEIRVYIEARQLMERERVNAKHKALLDAELAELESKHCVELEEHDATLPGKGRPCGTCDKECIDGDHFVCANCNKRHCNTHKGQMTTCVECDKSYCEKCMRRLPRCQNCQDNAHMARAREIKRSKRFILSSIH
ncbi:hypothetical protein KIPB_011773, partial [Kipferlia bialata]|eukprot:g11773.t1